MLWSLWCLLFHFFKFCLELFKYSFSFSFISATIEACFAFISSIFSTSWSIIFLASLLTFEIISVALSLKGYEGFEIQIILGLLFPVFQMQASWSQQRQFHNDSFDKLGFVLYGLVLDHKFNHFLRQKISCQIGCRLAVDMPALRT